MMSYYTALTKDNFGARKYKLQSDADDLKFDEEMKQKQKRLNDHQVLRLDRAKAAAKEIRQKDPILKVVELDDDVIVSISKEIDTTLFSIQTTHVPASIIGYKGKKWAARPEYWHDIVKYMIRWGYPSVCEEYAVELSNLKQGSKKATLNRWKREFEKVKVLKSNKDRLPAYGTEVEKGLISDVTLRTTSGLGMDNVVLRELLKARLVSTGQTNLLLENGGQHVYRYGWAQRFWKRNGFSNRAATTKMRDLPADFAEKKETYIRIAAKLIQAAKLLYCNGIQ